MKVISINMENSKTNKSHKFITDESLIIVTDENRRNYEGLIIVPKKRRNIKRIEQVFWNKNGTIYLSY